MIIISDTDFLSSLLKISRLEIARDLFNEENVHIPVAVLNEVAKTELITDLLSKDWIRVRKVKEGDLRKMERDKEFANLGSGEKECIVLCKQMRILNKDDIVAIIRDLKEKDYYEFSEEERNRLINT